MRIQTYSIVAGSGACNARCPFCVSRMTPAYDLEQQEPQVNWRNFGIGCRFAKDNRVSTVLITGKGEPTLFPEQLTRFLEQLAPHGFPFVELQTNGLALASHRSRWEEAQDRWFELGLSLVALSIVHHEPELNRAVYCPHQESYPDLEALVRSLHQRGFAVRLSCTMIRGGIDSVGRLKRLAQFARDNAVEQLTLRPVERPARSRDSEAAAWVEQNSPPPDSIHRLRAHLDARGTRLMELAHGAIVYDLEGQNVCLSNCLTLDPEDDRLRQLIFFPDGHLRYDWQYPGALLI